jgi:Rad3-related DNA helicase
MAFPADETIDAFFSEDGPLAAALDGYECRDAQPMMARGILDAFAGDRFLCCEAGTGVGKTLAYLLPAVLWALESGERVVVSTHTKNLQEQIFGRDLPLLASVLRRPFRYRLVKGKGNYLCLRRWAEFAAQPDLVPARGGDGLVDALVEWAGRTSTGDLSGSSPLDPRRDRELWARICCDTYLCSDAACPDHRRCFFKKVRRDALSAHVVVVNHSLLMADRLADGGVLGDYDLLILDESQNLAVAARESLKITIDRGRLRWLVGSLRGVVRKAGSASAQAIPKAIEGDVLRLCRRTERSVDAFFGGPPFDSGEGKGEGTAFPQRTRYGREGGVRDALSAAGSDLAADFGALSRKIEEAVESLRAADREEELAEIEGHLEMLREGTADISMLLEAEDDGRVFWIEHAPAGSVHAAPVDVAPLLREVLFSKIRAGAFTSATLRVMGAFDYFLRSTGLDGCDTVEAVYPSPFHYDEQAMAAVAAFLPDPGGAGYTEALVEVLRETLLELRRGTLVLFTSVRMLETCYRRLKEPLEREGIRCLGQGIDGSRERITRAFREDRRSVLFGTDSFREGVDIRGASLEAVVFTRLPFSVPSDPLSRAIEEGIRARGGDPFLEHFLPSAVMKFRQGFGRLIRSTRDCGVALILDGRVVRRGYGRAFLDALPVRPVVVRSREGWLPALRRWWAVNGGGGEEERPEASRCARGT